MTNYKYELFKSCSDYLIKDLENKDMKEIDYEQVVNYIDSVFSKTMLPNNEADDYLYQQIFIDFVALQINAANNSEQPI